MEKELSLQQNKVLEFVKKYFKENDESPTLSEIASHLGISAKSTVNQHVSALVKKGYIIRIPGTIRGLVLPEYEEGTVEVPLLGYVAAGAPIEKVEESLMLKIPKKIVPFYSNKYFALQIRGDSMIEDGIYDGEIAIIEHRNYADNGDLVVAENPDGNVTLKYFYKEFNRIRLEPRNSKLSPIYLSSCSILGILRGLTHSKEII